LSSSSFFLEQISIRHGGKNERERVKRERERKASIKVLSSNLIQMFFWLFFFLVVKNFFVLFVGAKERQRWQVEEKHVQQSRAKRERESYLTDREERERENHL
jgi:hypothetical protein